MTWTAPNPVCVRKAWLTLGTLSVPLEGPGWFCPSLDLGYPDVRDVVSNRPDQDGIDDRTAYFGARTVTAQIAAIASAGAQIDQVLTQFAPFMIPSNRPTLHYVLDRPGAPERTIKLRAAGFSGPIAGAAERDIQLQWVADDPAALDPVEQTVIAWAGSSTIAGRAYNLTFNRIYPPGGGAGTTPRFQTVGDLPIKPRVRIYGPVTRPYVSIYPASPRVSQIVVLFLQSFSINAGHYVEVSTANRTAYLDGDISQSVIAGIDWSQSLWGVVPTHTDIWVSMTGSSTSGVTQAQVSWHDRYLN
jgi:hypothetical protein